MKKEIFAALLLVVILTLSFINSYYLSKLADSVIELVKASEEAASSGDWEQASDSAEKAVKLWQSQDSYTHIVLRHSDIDSMTEDFYELLEHIYSHDLGETRGAAELVSTHLDSIRSLEKIRLGSIF